MAVRESDMEEFAKLLRKGKDEDDSGSSMPATPSVECGAVRDLATSGEENRSSKEEESKLLASSSAASLSVWRLLANVLLLRHSFLATEAKGLLRASAQEGSASSLTAADAASTLHSAAAPHTPVTPVFVSDSSDSSVSTSGTLRLLDSADRESVGSTTCLSSSLVKSVISLAPSGPEPGAALWLWSAGSEYRSCSTCC